MCSCCCFYHVYDTHVFVSNTVPFWFVSSFQRREQASMVDAMSPFGIQVHNGPTDADNDEASYRVCVKSRSEL